jgi:quercetin dioxygenase-like cupin family protein
MPRHIGLTNGSAAHRQEPGPCIRQGNPHLLARAAERPGKSTKGVARAATKSAFICATVLQGAIRSQVNDGPVTTYQAGQSFSELPGDRANASKTKAAKLLAAFAVDTNETELRIPFAN